MKKGRIFAKIIYYIFTFLLGIMLAFTLPYFMYVATAMRNIPKWLHAGQYDNAMGLIDGFHNKQYVYQEDFEGGGIVLFEATTLSENSGDEEDKTVDGDKIFKSYAGFIYGVQDRYEVFATQNNSTKLIVTDLDGNTKPVELLSYDKNGDGSLDGVATAEQNDYIFLEFRQEEFGSIKSLSFLDKNGNVFFASRELSLDYSGKFFDDVDEFVAEYNRDYMSANLNKLSEKFLGKDDNYAINTYGDLKKKADTNAAIVVVVYFVCIYIIADFLLGNHYIIKFFRWFLYKVCKIEPKRKQKVDKSEVFGHDYFSSVTMSLDVESVPEFNGSVQVRYTNSDSEITFILLKENGYAATERIKAGTYVNPFVDMNRDYTLTNLPDNLEVEGFRMDVKIKIIKREV